MNSANFKDHAIWLLSLVGLFMVSVSFWIHSCVKIDTGNYSLGMLIIGAVFIVFPFIEYIKFGSFEFKKIKKDIVEDLTTYGLLLVDLITNIAFEDPNHLYGPVLKSARNTLKRTADIVYKDKKLCLAEKKERLKGYKCFILLWMVDDLEKHIVDREERCGNKIIIANYLKNKLPVLKKKLKALELDGFIKEVGSIFFNADLPIQPEEKTILHNIVKKYLEHMTKFIDTFEIDEKFFATGQLVI